MIVENSATNHRTVSRKGVASSASMGNELMKSQNGINELRSMTITTGHGMAMMLQTHQMGNFGGSYSVSPIQVFSVSPDAINWILIDSGAAVSVCPPSWAQAIKIEPLNGIRIQGASGDNIKVYGVRRAQVHADRRTSFPMDFIVADAARPIISVAQLQSRKIESSFSHRGCYLQSKPVSWIKLLKGRDTLAHFMPSGRVSSACRSSPSFL